MRNLNTVRAPGSLESSTREYIQKRVESRNTREKTKTLSESYKDNLDVALKTSGFDDQTQKEVRKEMRTYLENPLVKKALIDTGTKLDLHHDEMTKLVGLAIDQKDSITQQIAERQKNINSLKGKKNYWTSQLNKTGGSTEAVSQKTKDIGDRVKLLEKQIQKAEKSGLDLSLLLAFSRDGENDNKVDINYNPINGGEMNLPNDEQILDSLPHTSTKPFESPLVQTGELGEINPNLPGAQGNLDRRANVGGMELRVHKNGENYVIDLPGGTTMDVGNDKTFAEEMFHFAVVQAGGSEIQKNPQKLAGILKTYINKEKESLEEFPIGVNEPTAVDKLPPVSIVPAVESRFKNSMPGFADFATNNDAKLRADIEARAALAGLLKEKEVAEQTPAPEKRMRVADELTFGEHVQAILDEKIENGEPSNLEDAQTQAKKERAGYAGRLLEDLRYLEAFLDDPYKSPERKKGAKERIEMLKKALTEEGFETNREAREESTSIETQTDFGTDEEWAALAKEQHETLENIRDVGRVFDNKISKERKQALGLPATFVEILRANEAGVLGKIKNFFKYENGKRNELYEKAHNSVINYLLHEAEKKK